MEPREKIERIYEQLDCPVLTVRRGIVSAVNLAAARCDIEVNTPINDLIHVGHEAYNELRNGTLFLTMRVGDKYYNASVVRKGRRDVFILDSEFNEPCYNFLSDLSQKMREPLSDAILCINQLGNNFERSKLVYINELKKRIYEMYRVYDNISAITDHYTDITPLLHNLDLTVFLESLLMDVEKYVRKVGYRIRYDIPSRHIICAMDPNTLSHAITNMLSNAMHFSNPKRIIYVKVHKRETSCSISVTNKFDDPELMEKFDQISITEHNTFFKKASSGIGLGLNVIRSAASTHKGTLLCEKVDDNAMTFTLTIPVKLHAQNGPRVKLQTFRTRKESYSGGYNTILTAFADILPPESFE